MAEIHESQRGVAVIADGEVVAWFAVFDEAAHDWCSEWYFGKWILWPAEIPVLAVLTPEQEAEVKAKTDEYIAFFAEQDY